jgi:hypothetical protein
MAQKSGRRPGPAHRPLALGREALLEGLETMIPALHRIAVDDQSLGSEERLHNHLLPAIKLQIERLEALS